MRQRPPHRRAACRGVVKLAILSINGRKLWFLCRTGVALNLSDTQLKCSSAVIYFPLP
jgi:hypothetical protein